MNVCSLLAFPFAPLRDVLPRFLLRLLWARARLALSVLARSSIRLEARAGRVGDVLRSHVLPRASSLNTRADVVPTFSGSRRLSQALERAPSASGPSEALSCVCEAVRGSLRPSSGPRRHLGRRSRSGASVRLSRAFSRVLLSSSSAGPSRPRSCILWTVPPFSPVSRP